MLNINFSTIEGLEFTAFDPNIHYKCIGFGQHPTEGVNYAVGAYYDSTNNRTEIKTFLLKDVKFLGNLNPTKI